MRILLCLSAIALVACGPGRTTFARYPGSPPAFDRATADPKALAIADKVLAAAGGAERWKAAKQLRWKEAITHDGKESDRRRASMGSVERQALRAGERGREGDLVVMRQLYENGGYGVSR